MTSFGFASYIIAGLFFAFITLLLSTGWRGRLQGGLLLLAVSLSTVWAFAGAVAGTVDYVSLKHFLALEVVRNAVWTAFLWHLLSFTRLDRRNHWIGPAAIGYLVFCIFTVVSEIATPVADMVNRFAGVDFRILSHVVQSVVVLFLVEQLFRNTRLELRWAIKFLCFGVGAIYAYDFVLYTESLLFSRIDPYIWDARGVVNALAVPLIAVAAARNPEWSVKIFVSRSVVFHTTGLLAMGVYLICMAVVGYYIRDFGGAWGRFGQVVFIAGALLILVLLMFSGRMRARIRVFFNRHFFSYKYDYRKEWLDLNMTIAHGSTADDLRVSCIRAVSDIVDSAGGALWLKRDNGFEYMAELNIHLEAGNMAQDSDSLVHFLKERKWVVEIPEYYQTPEIYEGLDLSKWCEQIPDLWLVIPLMQREGLYGFICLTNPRAPREINWEDHDLLKTVGQQLASYLALIDASDALAHARQFEAYNRLSAFIVHDLKNLVAQLSLVVRNAEKHKDNPAFIDDAMDTLAHSVEKMNRLLAQLRKGNIDASPLRFVELQTVLDDVVAQQNNAQPMIQLEMAEQKLEVNADQDKLVSIIGHLVQNAQEATDDDGWVKLRLYKSDNQAIIEVEDNGCGMDQHFIRDRLFKPFDTTKGNAGMGIGVFEARQLVSGYGGRIEVESEPGVGTRFRLQLPVSQRKMKEDSTEREVV